VNVPLEVLVELRLDRFLIFFAVRFDDLTLSL